MKQWYALYVSLFSYTIYYLQFLPFFHTKIALVSFPPVVVDGLAIPGA